MSGMNRIAGIVVAVLLLMPAGGDIVEAGDDSELYRARTIVTGQREETRGPGLAQCLIDVLVKVSGDPRLADDRRVADLASKAETLVSDFRYHDRMSGIPVHDEQGTRDRPYDLFASFERTRIDAVLRALGSKPWTGKRPQLVMVVSVTVDDAVYYLTGDGDRGRDQRDALEIAAARLGLPVVLPSEDVVADADIGKSEADRSTGLDAIAGTAGADLALAGDLVWSDAALGWVADWRLEVGGEVYRWHIGGVSFDKAFLSAMRGAAQILSGSGRPF